MGDSLQESLNSLNNKTGKKLKIFTYRLRLTHKYLPFACRDVIDRLLPHWLQNGNCRRLSPTVADLIHNADADATKVGSFVASSV